jgi:putative solute:sodium symporter small subunit
MPEPRFKDVNFFRPRGTAMRRETRVIILVLVGWLLAITGAQGAVYLLVRAEQGGLLPHWTFFNLPIPFWLTGQFLPLWFVILCVLFNIWMDRHASRDLDGTMRFRIRRGSNEED